MPDSSLSEQHSFLRRTVHALLDRSPVVDIPPFAPLAARAAVLLARVLQDRAGKLQTPEEAQQQAEFERMMENPKDKATLIQMTDQAFRSRVPERAVSQLTHILDIQGIPRFFSGLDRALLIGLRSFGGYLPGVAVPLIQEKMRDETANVVLPAEEEHLCEYLEARRQSGIRTNLNFLGEAILGEREAQARLDSYLAALQRPEVEMVSIKISTIYSQISSLAHKDSVETLSERLELLFRAAAKMRHTRGDGVAVPKFVYLDMEEYRDMRITAEAFMQALNKRRLENAAAGIALQAYLPDSYAVQQEINAWAARRVARGGSPVTLRLVKGANMEMERVEASLRGWPQAPFRTKAEVDANFKRMLHEGLRPVNIEAVRLGIASHNLFDLAYGLALAVEGNLLDKVQFEMLEGMANHQRRALFELTQNLLLYAPAVRKEEFINAIGYLIRRLDENTGPDNFLRHAFKLEVDSPEWRKLEAAFLKSFRLIEGLPSAPRRTQDRRRTLQSPLEGNPPEEFTNEPDTDFSLPHNLRWAEEILDAWRSRTGERAAEVPLVLDGEEILDNREVQRCLDPSRPGQVVARYREATSEDVRRAVTCARQDPDGWRDLPPGKRGQILAGAAVELRRSRGGLVGAALAEGGKTIAESDPEVSEAVDFAEYYWKSALRFHQIEGLRVSGKGAVVVVSPWNFPISIPCGGVAAALAAGNTVLLKPAPECVLTAYEVCRCFWRAGVSRRALQFVPCAESGPAPELVSHPEVDAVILTGGTETAFKFIRMKPDMNLLAETGGKNATIVTALSDREQAIKHVLHSAFGHAGQKCSATSLLILEEEVYDDPRFKEVLCDAVSSLRVGSAWELETRIGPLIRPPEGALETALKELEPGESWAVMPRPVRGNPHLWRPGVKWGVNPESFTHMTELFGPVLGVMKARNLEEAITLVNQTGYGLTSGLESLDDREQEQWREGIQAGNLYINRPTTGAVVLRQPFGGMGKSAFGAGIKAGGPNYVAQLMHFEQEGPPQGASEPSDPDLAALQSALAKELQEGARISRDETLRIIEALGSYARNAGEEFLKPHDHFRLVGEDNVRLYRPAGGLWIRLHPDDSAFEIFARVGAAKAVGCRVTVSFPRGLSFPGKDLLSEWTRGWAEPAAFEAGSDDDLARAILGRRIQRIRYAHPGRAPIRILGLAQENGVYVARAPVLAEGRVELLWYLREQSVSHAYHRHGNLSGRSEEARASTL